MQTATEVCVLRRAILCKGSTHTSTHHERVFALQFTMCSLARVHTCTVPDEVVETGQALWLSQDLTEMIFTYYACGSAGAAGRSDIGAISFNHWSAFCTDYAIMSKGSKFCKRSDLDRLFLAIDSMSARREAEVARLTGKKEVASSERNKAFSTSRKESNSKFAYYIC